MAWTKVAETTFVRAKSAGGTVTLPGTPLEDDIVIVGIGHDVFRPPITTSGYTNLYNRGSATNLGVDLGYKVMGGTPDSTVVFTNPDDTGRATAGVIQIWRGVDLSTPIDDPTATSATGTTGTPNPPSYTTITAGALRMAFGVLDDDDVAASVSAPSGYTNLLAEETGTAPSGATVMLASKEAGAPGAEDPAAFAGGYDAWSAVHFALRPVASGGWTGKIIGFTNPAKILGVPVADIAKVSNVA